MEIGKHFVGDYSITLSACKNPIRNNIIFRLGNLIIGTHKVKESWQLTALDIRLSSNPVPDNTVNRLLGIGDKMLFEFWIKQDRWYLFKSWK